LVNEPLRALVHFAQPAELVLVRPVRATSEQAARLFRERVFDLVFVDGDHALDAVHVDLALWPRLVRPGGTLAGHDYLPHRFPDVVREVDALAERLGQRPTLHHTCWSFRL
jgi:predicted O-methyltransferase YrrM